MRSPPGWWRCKSPPNISAQLELDGDSSDDIIGTLSAELSPGAGNTPDMVSTLVVPRCVAVAYIAFVRQGELSQEIATLHEDVKSIKLAQDTQIKAIKDAVKEDTKSEIVQLVGYVFQHTT